MIIPCDYRANNRNDFDSDILDSHCARPQSGYMAKTRGHSMRRYVGEKMYHAAIAARKAFTAPDNGAEPSDYPFWDDAVCICGVCDSCQADALLSQYNPHDAWDNSYAADCHHGISSFDYCYGCDHDDERMIDEMNRAHMEAV